VPAEHLAGRGAGVDADLEVKCLGQARNRNWLQPESGCTGSSDHMGIADITRMQTRIENQPEGKSTAVACPG
jgi:hypothetical protein